MTDGDPREQGQRIAEVLRQGRWAEALPLLEDWTRRHPGHLPGWIRRAQCLERLGRAAEAMECARAAERLDPADRRVVGLLDRLVAALPTAGPRSPGAAPSRRDPRGVAPAPKTHPDRVAAVPATEADRGGSTPSPEQGGSEEVPATRLDATGAPVTAADGAAAAPPDRTLLDPGGDPAAAASRTAVDDRPGPIAEADVGWPVGALVEGRYEVRGGVRGGMGTVAFVFDRELGMPLAVKTPTPAILESRNGRARFLREAEAWIGLGLHPNVCTAFYVREIEGLPRLFIEYVEGGTLTDWMKANPEATLEARLDLAIQIAAGMEHAHTFEWEDEDGNRRRGVVHRDLKPSNVLVGRDGGARVTDFGLVGRDLEGDGTSGGPSGGPCAGDAAPEVEATLVGDGSTAEGVWGTVTAGGTALGTPPYMAPEQWTGAHAAGAAADIYAFGCVLYELFCGRRPFVLAPSLTRAAPAAQRLAWERLHREEPAPHPRDLEPELDLALAELLHACLRKVPAERPPSFAQLAGRLRDLHRRLLGRPSPRPEPTTGELLADSLTNRGVSYVSLGRPQHAERAWRAAVEADPGHVGARLNLALFGWQRLGSSDDELVRTLEELRAGEAVGWREHLLAGRALLRLGRLHQAIARLRLAADHPEHAPEVVRDYAAALVALATETGDADPARRAAEALRIEGGALRADPRMLVCYALASRIAGNETAATRLWQEARRVAPELPEDPGSAAERLMPAVLMRERLAPPCSRVGLVAVSPNGRVAVAGGTSPAVAVWDLRRGERLPSLEPPEGDRLRSAAVSPDGQRCLVSVDGHAVAAWDLASGSVAGRLQPHTGTLGNLALGPDGWLAVGAGSAGTLFCWETATGRRLLELKTHPGNATALALAEDGRLAVVGGGDGRVAVVDLETGREIAGVAAHHGPVTAVAVDPRRDRLVTAAEDGALRTWSLASGEAGPTLHGHRGAVRRLALHPDGVRCLSASADGTARVWDLEAGQPVLALDRGEAVLAAAASADWGEVLLAVGGEVHRPRLAEARGVPPAWSLAVPVTSGEAEERGRRFRSRIETVHGLIASERYEQALEAIESARSVIGYARDREAVGLASRIASLFPREGLRDGWQERLLDGHDGEVVSAAIAPEGGRAVTGGRDRRLLVWSWPQGDREAVVELPSVPLALRVLAGGRQLASADLDGAIRIWDLEGAGLLQQLGGHEARVNALGLDLLGRTALSASEDGTARVWDPSTGACRHVLRGHLGRVLAAAVSPDGRLGLTGGDDGSLLLWDLDAGRGVGELEGHGGPVHDLDWSTDGRSAVSAGGDGCVRLWELPRGRALRVLDEGLAEPRRAVLTPDGRFALIGEKGGRLSVWALRARSCERSFGGHTGAITALELARDGRRLLSASVDGSARQWYLDWRPQLRPFAEWDEAARPHLEVFLSQQVPRAGGGLLRPEWGERDLQRLVRDLGHRGFGWLRPDGVRRRLNELAASWSAEDRARPVATDRVEPAPRLAATPHARRQLRLGVRRALIALAIALPLLGGVAFFAGRHGLRLDARQAKVLRARNMAVLLVPVQMASPGPCDPGQLEVYLRDFAGSVDRPSAVGRAIHCLQELRDPRAVAPILDMVRPLSGSEQPDLGIGSDPRRIRQAITRSMTGGLTLPELVASTLARFGEPAVAPLTRALRDRDPEVRSAAASALALSGVEPSADALRAATVDPTGGVREAAAAALPTLVVGGGVDLDEGFELVERLAGDPETRVRAAAARSLELFAGSRARRLRERLARDEHPDVRRAAGAP